jgi:spore maturation protein CgeB
LNILIVSDRNSNKSSTDYLVNSFARAYQANVIYTKSNSENINKCDKILNKINFERDKFGINKRLLGELDKKYYNIVFILKGNRIKPHILRKIKQLYPKIKLISWCGDNMTKWHNKSFYFHYGVNYYDMVFTVDIPDYKNIENFCKRPAFYFDKRADHFTHKPLNRERVIFKYNVLFIGSYEKERFNTLDFLAQNGIKIDIFGNMWDRCKDNIHQNLTVHYKELVGREYVQAISDAKITLGFLRKINNDTQTSRTFEIPACGGFMLMERTQEHIRLFKEAEEAEFFGNHNELLKKINYYLHNNEQRELVADNGRKRIERSGYYFRDMSKEMIEIIKNG